MIAIARGQPMQRNLAEPGDEVTATGNAESSGRVLPEGLHQIAPQTEPQASRSEPRNHTLTREFTRERMTGIELAAVGSAAVVPGERPGVDSRR
jgi:hypothetical protein